MMDKALTSNVHYSLMLLCFKKQKASRPSAKQLPALQGEVGHLQPPCTAQQLLGTLMSFGKARGSCTARSQCLYDHLLLAFRQTSRLTARPGRRRRHPASR